MSDSEDQRIPGETVEEKRVPPKRAPKTFLQTVQDHHYGFTADEATAALKRALTRPSAPARRRR